ncbi:MAG: hypothetical protein KF710_06365 [Rhodocyclaceae bacterium]|nr:hypothetical protein [Rhodocyclaceae bacterium]
MVRVRVRLINHALDARPASHADAASKCNWWPIDDCPPQYLRSYRDE